MDRAPINGIRLAKYAADEPNLGRAAALITRAFTDYAKEVAVSDAVFAGFLQFYDYGPIALNATVESADTTATWIMELVSVNAAYGGERLPIWIYRPVQASQPLQSVVFFPGSSAIHGGPSAGYNDATAEWILRSGGAGGGCLQFPAPREVTGDHAQRTPRFLLPPRDVADPVLRGTAPADKRHLIYEGGHDVPRTELIKESLGWFDKYLGPVR
jgi:hypothetical protein